MERTLILQDPQVLLHFADDAAGLVWHHRILLHKIGGGKWVVLTPDLELQVEDMGARRHIVLGRHAPFPGHLLDECYIFEAELGKAELDRQRRLARTMGAILDDSVQVGVEAMQWYVADPSSSKFGKPIPIERVEDVVTLGDHGLVQWEGDTLYLRELASADVESFVEERKEATGDLRTLGDHRDPQGKRHLSFKDGISLMRETKLDDWPFKGPRSVLEYLKAILAGPGELIGYHNMWLRSSGVAWNSAAAHEHHHLCEVLRLAISVDQLDVTNLTCCESVTRRLIVLEIAVQRSPQAPDFSGLDLVAETPVTSQGQAVTTAMNLWITERLKERAQIQKQSRLFREELQKKGKKGGDEDEEEGGKRWKKKKGKGGKGSHDGGGADSSAART